MPSLRALWLPVEVSFRTDWRRALLVFALSPVAGTSGVFYGLGFKWLIDSAVAGSLGATLAAATALAGGMALVHLLGTTTALARMSFQQLVGFTLDQRILKLCTELPTIEHHEHAQYLDRLELLREQRAQITGAFGALVENLRSLAQLGAVLALLGSLDSRLLLLPLFAVPMLLTASAAQRHTQRVEETIAPKLRTSRWLFNLATSAPASKELRVYGLAGEITTRYTTLLRHIHTRRGRAEAGAAFAGAAGQLMFAAGLIGATAIVANRAISGRATAGDVALIMTLAGQLDSALSNAVGLLTWLQRSVYAAGNYFWLVDYAAARTVRAGPARTRDVHSGELIVDRVSFAYPGADTPVLRDVSLRLPAGSVVALVGDNGAGKSTLVKLLCGLYEPTAGRIQYAGADLRDLGAQEWRAKISAAFQDFCRFELVARESIGVGDLASADSDEAVLAALARVGDQALLPALPSGLDTKLGRTYDNGMELSTGQWQRLALARCAMRPAPRLLILDEPTANLDPDAEYELFRRFTTLARQGKPTGVTIVVSHRFSTVSMADLIVVIDQGEVREVGSHAELVAREGLYAQLYRIQRRAYLAPATGHPQRG